MHERIRARHEERRERRRMEERDRRRTRSSTESRRGRTSNADIDTTGLSDERALYHMEQIGRKSTILTDKLDKFYSLFSSEEHETYRKQVGEYLKLEKVVAGYLQQTSDEFNKAKRQIERAKKAKNDRKDDEMAAREAARDKFLSIKTKLDERIDAHRQEL